jgi:hypothetical protein
MYAFMRRASIVFLAALAGCGGGGLEGTLRWEQPPVVSAHALNGSIQNTTSHSVSLSAKSMRLLDDHGRRVPARIRVDRQQLASGESTAVRATWKAGRPVRIDYGAGALALRSP